MSDDQGWLEPNDMMGLWEHQGRPLSTAALSVALSETSDDVPVEFEFYDGDAVRTLRAVHIDLRGAAGHATSFVVTIA